MRRSSIPKVRDGPRHKLREWCSHQTSARSLGGRGYPRRDTCFAGSGGSVAGVCGADADAGSFVTVVTSQHAEMAAGMGKLTFFDVLDPSAKHAQRNLMFLFACHGTGMAANTSILVNDESVSHAVELDIVQGGAGLSGLRYLLGPS